MLKSPKQTKFLLMHRGWGVVCFCELEIDEWQQVDNQPQRYQIYVLDGQKAKILVATEDRTLNRQNALNCATSFVLGAYDKISVDLDKLDGSWERGQPLIHPPL